MKKLNLYVNAILMVSTLSISLSPAVVLARQQDSIGVNQFVQEAATSGMKEVKMGEMGRQKTQNTKIRDYATMIVTDHSAANTELKTLATSKNISLDTVGNSGMPVGVPKTVLDSTTIKNTVIKTTDSSRRDTAMRTDHEHEALMQASGADFDARFLQMMVDDHDKAIALFEKGSKVSDPDVKAFAKKHLPTLRRHLNEAVKLSKEFGNTKTGKQSGTN